MFQRGVELADAGRLGEACTQFDGSLQIEPALGTLFRLADCYDRIGRTASAWALFSEAQARAKAAAQLNRERIAAERVTNLEARLSKLTLSLGDNAALPGAELRMNDVLVPRASWDLALPVDPGVQRVRLSAPGYRDWVGAVNVEQGPSAAQLTVPALVPSPRASEPAAAAKASLPVARTSPASTAEPSTASEPYPRWLGYAVGGAGLVGLGVASVFGYRAYDLNQQSLDQCSSVNANACTRAGDALRNDARRAGVMSTVFAVAGGALVATGLTLVVLLPSRAEAPRSALRLTTTPLPLGCAATLTGAF